MVLIPSSEGGDQRQLKTLLDLHKALQLLTQHSSRGSSSQSPVQLVPSTVSLLGAQPFTV